MTPRINNAGSRLLEIQMATPRIADTRSRKLPALLMRGVDSLFRTRMTMRFGSYLGHLSDTPGRILVIFSILKILLV